MESTGWGTRTGRVGYTGMEDTLYVYVVMMRIIIIHHFLQIVVLEFDCVVMSLVLCGYLCL